MQEDIRCELITASGDLNLDEGPWLVQWDENYPIDRQSRIDCLQLLGEHGIHLTRNPHPIVGIDDDPAVSWADLADLILN